MVTSGQQNKATDTKSENDACMFLIQLFEKLIFIPVSSQSTGKGSTKTGTKRDPLIL